MPSECVTNPLQRALADAIITMQPLDELRILLACGAKVHRSLSIHSKHQNNLFRYESHGIKREKLDANLSSFVYKIN